MFSKLIRFHLMLIYHHRWNPSSGGQRTVPNSHDLQSFLINHLLCTGHFSSNALNGPEWSIGLGHGNRLGFSELSFPWWLSERLRNPIQSDVGRALLLDCLATPLPALLGLPPSPFSPFLLQSSHRVEVKEFPCKISLPRNASWYINVKYSLF